MAINATNEGGNNRPRIDAGNYIARCVTMIHIGTIEDTYMGEKKILNKVRITWELPFELHEFKAGEGEMPLVISKEYTLSLHEKSTLRKTLASWRGKDFSEDEAKRFDITKLLGKPCMLNIIHKPSKDGTKVYEEVASIASLAKGTECPPQINKTKIWDYDTMDMDVFNALPDFIKQKIQSSREWKEKQAPNEVHTNSNGGPNVDDDLPF